MTIVKVYNLFLSARYLRRTFPLFQSSKAEIGIKRARVPRGVDTTQSVLTCNPLYLISSLHRSTM